MSSPTNIHVDTDGVDVNATLCQGMIRSLLYLRMIHYDIIFSSIMCAHYQAYRKSHILKLSNGSLDT